MNVNRAVYMDLGRLELLVNLDEIALLSQIVASVAVVGSLAYLAVQVRQNTRAAQSATYQSVVSNSMEILATMYSEDGNAELWLKATDTDADLSPVEQTRFHFLMLAMFRHFDNLHYQHVHGAMESQQWHGYAQLLDGYLSASPVAAWWASNSAGFSASFRNHVRDRLSSGIA